MCLCVKQTQYQRKPPAPVEIIAVDEAKGEGKDGGRSVSEGSGDEEETEDKEEEEESSEEEEEEAPP